MVQGPVTAQKKEFCKELILFFKLGKLYKAFFCKVERIL